ncbi:MAG: hypothetical protein HPY74_13915 [Firmicutes bacterium]|nr:hypothetical protein [Bacillota bacterium]
MKKNYNYSIDNKIIINCVHCLSKLKVPLDKGKILVTCPVCRKEFIYNPNSIIHTLKQIIILMKSLLLGAKNKFPLLKGRIKGIFVKNKKKVVISIFIILIILFILILSLFLKLPDKDDKNMQVKPGPTVILNMP